MRARVIVINNQNLDTMVVNIPTKELVAHLTKEMRFILTSTQRGRWWTGRRSDYKLEGRGWLRFTKLLAGKTLFRCVRILINLIGINFATKSKWCATVNLSNDVVNAVYGCSTWLRYTVLERGRCGKIRAALIVQSECLIVSNYTLDHIWNNYINRKKKVSKLNNVEHLPSMN